jgi:hypothetical protein
MRKKSSIMSDLSLEMLSVDADKDDEEKASDRPSLGASHRSSAENHNTSTRSQAHWRDSGHSTLVADMNASNNDSPH